VKEKEGLAKIFPENIGFR